MYSKKIIILEIIMVILSFDIFAQKVESWDELISEEYYTQETCRNVLEAECNKLKCIKINTITRKVCVYYRDSEQVVNTQKLLITSEPIVMALGGSFQAICINSISSRVEDSIFYDERKICIAGRDSIGNTKLLYFGFNMDKMVEKEIGNLKPSSGGFFLKDFYFWDSQTKYVYMFRLIDEKNSILAMNNMIQFDSPKFFLMTYPVDSDSKYLFVTEVDENQTPVTGEYYFVPDLRLAKMSGRLKN